MKKRLFRSNKDRIIGGVCGGLGEYFDVDPVIFRIGWVAAIFAGMGLGLIAYIIAWIAIQQNPGQAGVRQQASGICQQPTVHSPQSTEVGQVSIPDNLLSKQADSTQNTQPIQEVPEQVQESKDSEMKIETQNTVPVESQSQADDENKKERKSNVLIGIVLVFIGALFLLSRFIHYFNVLSLWPVILIIIGLAILLGRK